MNINNLTILQARRDLDEKKYSAVELAREYLSNIKKNEDLNMYIEVFSDVEEQAKKADKIIESGKQEILCGIPVSVKDNILIHGRRTSAASKILEGYNAVYDATVIKKIKEKGGVLLGHTNMDEFAMGSSTENSAFGVVKNPHDKTRVSGGSSGGSVATIASHSALVSLGSDTGGSIRQPASFCGVVGLKPTYGTVSRYGLIAMGSSLDQIGPISNTVGDTEIMFNTIKGHDTSDSTSLPESLVNDSYKENKNKVKRIGVARDMLQEGVDKDVLLNFEAILKALKDKGYEIVDIELPYAKYALAVYYIIMPAEVSTNLTRFDGVRYGLHIDGDSVDDEYSRTRSNGFGPEVRRRILLGTHILSAGYYDAYYTKAQTARQLITDDYKKVFESVDIIATPTSPTPAFKIGEIEDPISMYLSDIFTVTANLTGMPALSVPSGFVDRNDKKLPVGFHIVAPHFHEEVLFGVGYDIESAL